MNAQLSIPNWRGAQLASLGGFWGKSHSWCPPELTLKGEGMVRGGCTYIEGGAVHDADATCGAPHSNQVFRAPRHGHTGIHLKGALLGKVAAQSIITFTHTHTCMIYTCTYSFTHIVECLHVCISPSVCACEVRGCSVPLISLHVLIHVNVCTNTPLLIHPGNTSISSSVCACVVRGCSLPLISLQCVCVCTCVCVCVGVYVRTYVCACVQ